jgi:RimJ/RimL family protein N-acetyltransferase
MGPEGWDLAPRLAGRLAILEPLAESHHDALAESARPREIWTWWPIDVGGDFDGWFAQALLDPDADAAWHFATLDARTGHAVGSTSFTTPRPTEGGIEIGWTWLTPQAWGTGINVEVKLLQLAYAFDTLGVMRVEFETDERNVRSRRALKALGATFEGVWRDYRWLPDGDRSSSAYYSILDREWPAVRTALDRRVQARLAHPGDG